MDGLRPALKFSWPLFEKRVSLNLVSPSPHAKPFHHQKKREPSTIVHLFMIELDRYHCSGSLMTYDSQPPMRRIGRTVIQSPQNTKRSWMTSRQDGEQLPCPPSIQTKNSSTLKNKRYRSEAHYSSFTSSYGTIQSETSERTVSRAIPSAQLPPKSKSSNSLSRTAHPPTKSSCLKAQHPSPQASHPKSRTSKDQERAANTFHPGMIMSPSGKSAPAHRWPVRYVSKNIHFCVINHSRVLKKNSLSPQIPTGGEKITLSLCLLSKDMAACSEVNYRRPPMRNSL